MFNRKKAKLSLLIVIIFSIFAIGISNANVKQDKIANRIKDFSPDASPVFIGEENEHAIKTAAYKSGNEIFRFDTKTRELVFYENKNARKLSNPLNKVVPIAEAKITALNFKNAKYPFARNYEVLNIEYLDHGSSAEYLVEFGEKQDGVKLPSYLVILVDANSGQVHTSYSKQIKSTIPSNIMSEEEAINIAKSYYPNKQILETKSVLDQWQYPGEEEIKTRWTIYFKFQPSNDFDKKSGRVTIDAIDGTLLP